MSDSDVEIQTEETSNVGRDLTSLTERSQERYKTAYTIFKNWLTEKGANIDEKTLLEYFVVRNAKLKAAASLWAEYSILKSTISHYDSVDISKFSSLLTFLKKKNEGYRPRKANVFTKKDFTKFLSEAPDEKYLLLKVAMIFGIGGACSREELYSMKVESVEERSGLIIVTVPSSNAHSQRSFIVKNKPYEKVRCLDIYHKYRNLRPKNPKSSHLFVNYRDGKCTRQVVGINTVASWPSRIAEYLKLKNPADYTGHSFRRSAAALLASESGQLFGLRRRRKSSSTIEEVEDSVENKIQFATQILHDGPSCTSESETSPLVFIKSELEELLESHGNAHDNSCELNPFLDIKSEPELKESEAKFPPEFGNLTPESYHHLLKEYENLKKEVERLKQELVTSKQNEMRREQIVRSVKDISLTLLTLVNQDSDTIR